jgi:hypothetical protein
MLAPIALAPGQTLPSLDQVLRAPLLRVLGRNLVGRQVIIDGLMSRVNGHRPRNLVGVLACEESCRLAGGRVRD